MAPLLLCGFGIAFLIVVITSHGIDLVPDSIGLALYAVGLWRLSGSSRTLLAAATVAGFAALVGLTSFVPDAFHGTAEHAVDVTFGTTVAITLGLGAWGLRHLAGTGDPVPARQLLVIAVLEVLVVTTLAVGYAVNASDHDLAVSIIAAAALVNLLTMVWYAVLLLACASRPWGHPRPSPHDVPHVSATP